MRRLAKAGLIERLTEPARDRVTAVRVTDAGWNWVVEHCWPGALADIGCGVVEDSLLETQHANETR